MKLSGCILSKYYVTLLDNNAKYFHRQTFHYLHIFSFIVISEVYIEYSTEPSANTLYICSQATTT